MAVRKMITMNPQITIVDDTHFIIDEHHCDNLNGTSYLWSRSNGKRVRISNYRLAALADAVVERDTPLLVLICCITLLRDMKFITLTVTTRTIDLTIWW